MTLSSWMTVCLQLLLHSAINWRQNGVEAIRAVAPPVSTAGVVGQEAEFSCSVADKSANEILTWRLEWDESEFPQSVHLQAVGQNATTFSYDEGFFQEKHATYTTSYSVNGSVHTTVLHITNIQPSDEGSVACVYQINLDGSLITGMIPEYTPVRFTVWTPPSPTCSFANLDPNATALDSPTVGAIVELKCADAAGIPTPELTWKADTERNSSTAEPGIYRHELRPEDNGKWFDCEARSAATEEPVLCRVKPMRVHPTAEVTPLQLQLVDGAGNIEFTCTGNGIPEIVSYQWFINGSPTYAVDYNTYTDIRIATTATGSIMTVEKISKLGETLITCEVTVPAGLTGRASGTVIIYERERTGTKTPAVVGKQSKHNSGPSTLSLAPSAIAVPLAVIFLLLVLAIALFIWHRTHRLLPRDAETYRDTQKLAPSPAGNGDAPRHTKRFWAYTVTTV